MDCVRLEGMDAVQPLVEGRPYPDDDPKSGFQRQAQRSDAVTAPSKVRVGLQQTHGRLGSRSISLVVAA